MILSLQESEREREGCFFFCDNNFADYDNMSTSRGIGNVVDIADIMLLIVI